MSAIAGVLGVGRTGGVALFAVVEFERLRAGKQPAVGDGAGGRVDGGSGGGSGSGSGSGTSTLQAVGYEVVRHDPDPFVDLPEARVRGIFDDDDGRVGPRDDAAPSPVVPRRLAGEHVERGHRALVFAPADADLHHRPLLQPSDDRTPFRVRDLGHRRSTAGGLRARRPTLHPLDSAHRPLSSPKIAASLTISRSSSPLSTKSALHQVRCSPTGRWRTLPRHRLRSATVAGVCKPCVVCTACRRPI